MKLARIHVWAPGIRAADGGIQAYSAGIVADLRELGFSVRAIVRNDRSLAGLSGNTAGRLPTRFRAVGFAGLATVAAITDRPDLIFLTHLHFAPLASGLKQSLGIPFTTALHGGEAWNIRGERERRALKNSHRLLPVSQFTADQVQAQLDLPAGRFHVLRNAADEKRFFPGPKPPELARQLAIPSHLPVIFSMGRLEINHRYKHVDSVIRATAELIRQGKPAVLVIGGDGSDRPRLEALAHSENMAEFIRFTGRIPEENLPDYYRLADVFALPSTGEGFGIVYLEALLSGLPVIAGNRGGAIEAVDYGRLGLALDPDRIPELTQQLRLILERRHPHPLLQQPGSIRQETKRRFGSLERQNTLHQLLCQFSNE